MSKTRLDQILTEFYPGLSRSKAQRLIEKGRVEILTRGEWKIEIKPSAKFEVVDLSADQVRVSHEEELDYVSRGALKLKRAVEEFKVDVAGKVCLDVGLSTGGFTDYLLKKSARKILGIDVGTAQLHPSLREDPRLMFRDKINAKEPLPSDLLRDFFAHSETSHFDLIVVDVSFISLSKIIPMVVTYLKPQGELITLVKPQFELQRRDLNKKGVVKEEGKLVEVRQKIFEVLRQNKLVILGDTPSPIEGENGNKEFLILSHRS